MSEKELENGEDSDALSPEEEKRIENSFRAFDKDQDNCIDANELKTVLEMMGQKTSEEEIYRMLAMANSENSGKITLEEFKNVILEQKRNQTAMNEEDTLDAFVSMGGGIDRSGCIDAQELINIIKKEFEMTINIEELIAEIDEDGSGEIEYDEFRNLLSSSD